MSNLNAGSNSQKNSYFWVYCLIAGLVFLVYLLVTRERFDKQNTITGELINDCLSGSNEMTDDRFERYCEGKSFVVAGYPDDCTYSSSCELSLIHPKDPKFNSDSLFEVDLVRTLSFLDKKLEISGVISDRGFFGKVEVNVYKQEVAPLSDSENASIEQWSKPTFNPVIAAQKLWLESKAEDNSRMMEYAEKNNKKLSDKALRVVVNQDAIPDMAEWRYYMPGGKIISCLRGYQNNTFVYDCTNH